jgi:hypothetical protein
LGGVFGELALARSLGNDQSLSGIGKYASVVAILAFASLAAFVLGPGVAPKAFQSISGLVERVFIGLVLAWMLLVSSMLLVVRSGTEFGTS